MLRPHFAEVIFAHTNGNTPLKTKAKILMDFQPDHSGNNFPFSKGTTLWTVACSTVGGIYKAQASPTLLLNTVSLDGSVAVVCYAFLSAVVGYCTKKGLDYLFKKFKK